MKLCNETITVFNTYIDPITRLNNYLSTQIVGASWFGEVISTVNDDGLISASKYHIRIPINADMGGKTFVSPKEYASALDKSKLWTLNEGDTIVKGSVSSSHTTAKPSVLRDNYDEVVTVVNFTDNRRVSNAPHWKVVAK